MKKSMKDVLETHKAIPPHQDPWKRPLPPPSSFPLNEYGYAPLSAVRKGKRTWEPRVVSLNTMALATELLRMAHPNAPADASVTREFDTFVVLNAKLGSLDILLFLFATDLLLQGLMASTVDTYVCGILRCKAHMRDKITGPFVNDIKKILEEIQCHEEVTHAKDIDEALAARMLRLLDGAAQVICFLMIICGARVADLMDMKRCQVVFLPSMEARISFHVTKNHRSKAAMYSIIVPICAEVPNGMAKFLSVPDAPLIALDTNAFNSALHEVGSRYCDLAGITSYSFRRLFVQRNIARFSDPKSHFTDWATVVKLTGHSKIETVRTCYTRTGDDTL